MKAISAAHEKARKVKTDKQEYPMQDGRNQRMRPEMIRKTGTASEQVKRCEASRDIRPWDATP